MIAQSCFSVNWNIQNDQIYKHSARMVALVVKKSRFPEENLPN
jgi:hypothetical protein